MDSETQARDTARLLVNLAEDGELRTVSETVRTMTEPGHRMRLGLMLRQLLSASATMIRKQVGAAGDSDAIVLDLRKPDGSVVDINALAPEVRAVVRALLAELYGHPDDLTDQISFALRGRPEGLIDGITVILMWTVSALAWCEDNDEPAPNWLTTSVECERKTS